MSTPAKPSSPASSSDANAVLVLSFDERLRLFWQKNGSKILIVCAILLIAIIAKGGWDALQASKQRAISADYASAGSTPEKLQSFATANPGHVLSGIALLRVADEDYKAGKYAEAITGYEKAATVQGDTFLAARAKLGLAMAKVAAGRGAEGETSLTQIANDATIDKAFRAEAAYQLASLAFGAGKMDEVKKNVDLITQIDPASPWAQRALYFQAATTGAVPVAGGNAPVPPVIQFNAPGK